MGSFLHPVGPMPAGAYWLRRLLLLVVLLALVGGGWWFVSGRASGSASATPPPSTEPSSPAADTTSPTVTTTPSTTPSTTTSPTSPASTTATASAAPVACASGAIAVQASTDAGIYPPGAHPLLTVTVTNVGSVPCIRDLGQAAMGLIVSSGKTRVWSSDDCAPGGPEAAATLRPGQRFSSTVSWDRVTSKPGCPAGQPAAAPGTYQLVARNVALTSAPRSFSLR
jgi:zona occludens toxin (predicted ATPase)